MTQTKFHRRGAKNSVVVRLESKELSKAGCKNCGGGGALTQRKFQRRDAKIAQEEDASLKKLGTERLIDLVEIRRLDPTGGKRNSILNSHHPKAAIPYRAYRDKALLDASTDRICDVECSKDEDNNAEYNETERAKCAQTFSKT